MANALARLNPFTTPETRRLAILFGVVYFAQGMWNLPAQTMTILLKEEFRLSAGAIATFFSIATIPWLVKPVYGLVSDFVPLGGARRKGYLLFASALACGAAVTIAWTGARNYWPLALLYTVMGLGLAINDVMADALMVEAGRPRGLTGAFQSVQWAAIYGASILVGLVGGRLAEARSLALAFTLAAAFPLLTLGMTLAFVREPRAEAGGRGLRETAAAIRQALGDRTVWVVAAFILFFTFSPSIGTALFFFQTDTLGFSQTFIGVLTALAAASAVVGAVIYAPLSRRVSLYRLIQLSIGVAAVGTLGFLLYRNAATAVTIELLYGCVGMITQLAFLDLAAKACPRRAEGTFFALLMSVYNAGVQGSQVVGGYVYDALGYTTLVFISAFATALAWAFLPFVDIRGIERRARAQAGGDTAAPDSSSAVTR